MSTSLARRERIALCDLALALGEDAPTLCTGWDAKDLVAHLLLRERKPIAASGVVLSPMSRFTDRAMAGYRKQDFGLLVEKLRSPGLMFALPVVEKAANTMEYVVHHEDLRRGQPDWQPRVLDPADEDELWSMLSRGASFAGRKLPVPVVVRRAGTDATATAQEGRRPRHDHRRPRRAAALPLRPLVRLGPRLRRARRRDRGGAQRRPRHLRLARPRQGYRGEHTHSREGP